MSKSDKTIVRSFRISEGAFNVLNEEATRQKISVNTLVNQLILSYADFDRFAKKLHIMKLTTMTLRTIFEAAPEDAIREAGQTAGRNAPQVFIMAKVGKLTLDTAIDFLRSLADNANLFEYNEVIHDGKRSITLTHELGPKWTLFLSHYTQTLFELVDKHPVFSLSDNAILLEI